MTLQCGLLTLHDQKKSNSCSEGFFSDAEGCLCSFDHLRRAEEFQLSRALDHGSEQFFSPLPGEQPPWTRSLWCTSDGYFYALRHVPAEVSHRNFVTPTLVMKASWLYL